MKKRIEEKKVQFNAYTIYVLFHVQLSSILKKIIMKSLDKINDLKSDIKDIFIVIILIS